MKNSPLSGTLRTDGSDEQLKAAAAGLTVRVYRLQEQLRRLPLHPSQPWLQRVRAHDVEELFKAARRDRCLPCVNPWAASS
jgi:hypothetical protein